jgi:hypothetical protein
MILEVITKIQLLSIGIIDILGLCLRIYKEFEYTTIRVTVTVDVPRIRNTPRP